MKVARRARQPGPSRPRLLYPYQRQLLERLRAAGSNPEVVVQWPSQIGKTEVLRQLRPVVDGMQHSAAYWLLTAAGQPGPHPEATRT